MHPTILALAIPAFQDALFPRDSDLDDFLDKRFPAVFQGSKNFTKAGKIAALLFAYPQEQIVAEVEQYAAARNRTLAAEKIQLWLTQSGGVTGTPQSAITSGMIPVSSAVGSPLTEIFRLRGLHMSAYVEPDQAAEVQMHIQTSMVTLLVEGPSGVGKSTVVEQALKQLQLFQKTTWISSAAEQDKIKLDRLLDVALPADTYLVVDDFHLLDRGRQERITRLVKVLASPRPGTPPSGKLILIGINPVSASLLNYMHDVRGCYAPVQMVRQSDDTIRKLIERGSQLANLSFAAAEGFVTEAKGNFVIAQRLCRAAAMLAKKYEVPAMLTVVPTPLQEVVNGVQRELESEFAALIRAFASFDEQAPPRGACLLLLWRLAHSAEAHVPFHEVQYRDAELRPAFEWLLRSNLGGFFERNPGLPKLFHYNREAGVLSAEDPQLQFYLRHLDWSKLALDTNHRVERWDPESGPVFLPMRPDSGRKPSSVSSSSLPRLSISASAQSPKHPSGQTPVSRSHVLHLSDLHFSSPEQAIAWQSQLASDLKHELGVSSLSALVVSGDIANTAEPAQYETASRFLQELGGEFGLTPQQIVLVPGNHDVGWKQSKRAYIPMRRDDHEGPLDPTTHISDGRYIELRDDSSYKLRFESFAKFYEAVRTEDYPLEYSDQATIHHFPEQDLLFVGMNSAWHIDHHFKERVGLHPGAVSRALSQIRTTPDYATCVKFAVFHHPPEQFQESAGFDASVLEQLVQAGFQFVMHGHIHAAKNDLFRYDRSVAGRKLEILGAGTFGAPTHELRHGYPFQYQLLDITSRTLTVHTRRREEVAGAWKPDARWLQGAGKDPIPRYEIELSSRDEALAR